MLPDLALLEIFDFYLDGPWIEEWHTLVHVCRNWRNIVFGSPRRLNLRLYCTASTPVRETLNVWPLFPIVIRVSGGMWGLDNVVAALEHNDRICEFDLSHISSSLLGRVLGAMQRPFPALTRLQLWPSDDGITAPVQPPSFLGGSSPQLRSLILGYIPFPGLPKLLLSATHLVYLTLWKIPRSGYFSPEAMVACLSVLTKLEGLVIRFESPRSRPDQNSRRPPPQTRTVLPALTELRFKGVAEYLEDVVARIDAPLLDKLGITFFHQMLFHSVQLTQFISRTPKFRTHDEARVSFSNSNVSIKLPQTLDGVFELGISCRQSNMQLSSLVQVCSSSFSQVLSPAVEHLYIIQERTTLPRWQDNFESRRWLELLRSFTAVKDLYISQELVPRVARALQALVDERVTEVLPALQGLFLDDSLPPRTVQKTIGQFVAARQLSSQPIAVFHWVRR